MLINRRKIIVVLSATALLMLKMILLEKFSIGQPPFEFVIVAAIIPVAILFGVIGIVGISIGCTIAHSLNFIGLVDVVGVSTSVLLGTSLAYIFIKKTRFPGRFFLANLIITFSMTTIWGISWAYHFNIPVELGMQTIFASVWIGLNIVGYLLQQAIRRVMVHYQVIDPF